MFLQTLTYSFASIGFHFLCLLLQKFRSNKFQKLKGFFQTLQSTILTHMSR